MNNGKSIGLKMTLTLISSLDLGQVLLPQFSSPGRLERELGGHLTNLSELSCVYLFSSKVICSFYGF